MFTALSLIILLGLSFFFVRLASVALILTGMSEHDARFQSLSALTGTGYTTTDAELVVNYPIRRRIISWLMILGNLGIVSIASTTMISFIHVGPDFSKVLVQLAWIIGSIVMFFAIMMNKTVDRVLCKMIGYLLQKYTFLGGRHYRRLLQLGDGLSVGEHQFFTDESLTTQDLQASLSELKLLAIHRSTGQTEICDTNTGLINRCDKIIVLGHDEAHEKFSN